MHVKQDSIVIWGAGRIGRGFVADLFQGAGYAMTFVDADSAMVAALKKAGRYTVLKITGKDEIAEGIVEGFEVHSSSDATGVAAVLQTCKLMAVCVFPAVFESVAASLVPELERRAGAKTKESLDILVCANINHPSAKLRACFEGKLSDAAQRYFDESVGLVDTAVMRMAIEASPEQKARDALVVVTNGYSEMPVDASAFKGSKPNVPGMVFVANMRAEETRKMYTYNMLHALYSYVGQPRGHTFVYECTQDPMVQAVADAAMDEVSQSLIKEFGYTVDEMKKWKSVVLKNMANPALMDKLVRVGADPERKLKRDDRLVGPALLCRKNGIMPYYLAKAIAGAFTFNNPEDANLEKMNKFLTYNGIKATVRQYCQLDREPELVQLIAELYQKNLDGLGLDIDSERVAILKKAYEFGFKYEKTYKGCAQCALAAFFELTGKTDVNLFMAASGLSGGIAITGDGSCGGYTGGVLFMGSQVGRRLERIPVDGDKIDQYRSYEMAQKLHDKYLATYGSVTCSDIHNQIFGKFYCLRTKAVRDEFELAGAHADKCTTVIAIACAWIAEIMLDEKCLQVAVK